MKPRESTRIMIHFKGKNRKTSILFPPGVHFLLWGGILLLILVLIFGVYTVLRRTAKRISADYYYPFLKAAVLAEKTAADQSLLLQSKIKLARALRYLMTENAILASERAIVADLKRENAQLRSLMKLGRKGTFKPVFAEVLSRNPVTWQEQFVVDKGSQHGIEVGNPVVTSTLLRNKGMGVAVIGKVTSVTGKTALVTTVLSQDFKMAVSLPESNTSGILEGAQKISDMQSVLKYLPLSDPPVTGQVVYTNIFSGKSPPGLPVGIIAPKQWDRSGVTGSDQLYITRKVTPFQSPAEVRFVAIFIKEKE